MFYLYGMALDGDASLLFEIHVVEHLPLSDFHSVGLFKQTVGKCRLSVVYVCNNAKVSYMFHVEF